MNEFFQMGSYAFYVWTSYVTALIVLVANVWIPLLKHRKNILKAADLRELQGLEADDA